MMWSEKTGDEVYVYFNGELIYKKWLSQDNSIVMNNPRNWKHDTYFVPKGDNYPRVKSKY